MTITNSVAPEALGLPSVQELESLAGQYLKDLYRDRTEHQPAPLSLKLCDALFALGALLIVISQFTGLFYTFDEQNIYHRAPTYTLSYLAPTLIVLLTEKHSSSLSPVISGAFALPSYMRMTVLMRTLPVDGV